MFASFRRRYRGFTLIELIAVVVVLGILAALAVPTFNSVKRSSAEQTATRAAEAVVHEARALAAFDGMPLDGDYIDQALADYTGTKNLSPSGNFAATITIARSGVTVTVTIANDGTIAVVPATNGGGNGGGSEPVTILTKTISGSGISWCTPDLQGCTPYTFMFNATNLGIATDAIQVGDTITFSGFNSNDAVVGFDWSTFTEKPVYFGGEQLNTSMTITAVNTGSGMGYTFWYMKLDGSAQFILDAIANDPNGSYVNANTNFVNATAPITITITR